MITEILVDSVEFIVMLFICVLMFANSIAVLNKNRDDENQLFDARFGYPLDGFIQQYLLGLGEFNTDPYDE